MLGTPSYPTGGQYQEALQNPSICFKDPVLVAGKPTLDTLGLPKPISGNFASVFTINGSDGKRWAVKCFTRYVADQEIRYQRISKALSGISKPWRVLFDYVPEGILCRGRWYPILKMEWIEAKGLIPFIEAHVWQSSDIVELAAQFARMVGDLSELGIAHGDLQHGNLLVTATGELKLIDYDGMYVPGLDRLGASETGHANYQSPMRSIRSWGPDLDHFSVWVIYSSLVALAIDPVLWTLLRNEGDEALLFRKDDFVTPTSSRALVLLSQCTDDGLKALSGTLASFWMNDLGNIPALDTKRGPVLSNQASSTERRSLGTDAMAAELALAEAIAEWRASIGTASTGAAADAANDPSWILDHTPPMEAIVFQPANRILRILSGTVVLALVALAILGGMAILPRRDAGAGAATLVVIFLISSVVLFHQTDEARAKRESRMRYRERHAMVSAAERSASKAEKDRRAVDQRERQAFEGINKRACKLRESEQRKSRAEDARFAAQLSRISAEMQSLQSAENAEIGNELRALQDQHLMTQLANASVGAAGIQGIGEALTRALAVNGVTTAADFTGIAYGAGSEVFINLRNGGRVHPSGIGEVKANALEAWRREVEARARRSQPSSLPLGHVQAIRVKYARRRQLLTQEEHSARAESEAKRNQSRGRVAADYAALAAELLGTRDRYVLEKAQADLRLRSARQAAGDVTWQQVRAQRELDVYREVTYWRYLACVVRI